MASLASERRRCRLKIAEEEILPESLEVQGRRLLPWGPRADVPPAPLPGMTHEQNFLAHVLISPSSGSSSMGSVGTALPSPSGGGEAVFGQTWPSKGRKHVCRELGAVASTSSQHQHPSALLRRGPRDEPPPSVAQLLPDNSSVFLTHDHAWEAAWFMHEEINSGVGVMPRHSHSRPPEIQIFSRAYHNRSRIIPQQSSGKGAETSLPARKTNNNKYQRVNTLCSSYCVGLQGSVNPCTAWLVLKGTFLLPRVCQTLCGHEGEHSPWLKGLMVSGRLALRKRNK